MKHFIYKHTGEIKNLFPLTTVVNEYGKTMYFFFISSKKELKTLKNYFISNDLEYKSVLNRSQTEAKGFLKYLINRCTVAIIDKPYKLNKFLSKDGYLKLNSFTNINAI